MKVEFILVVLFLSAYAAYTDQVVNDLQKVEDIVESLEGKIDENVLQKDVLRDSGAHQFDELAVHFPTDKLKESKLNLLNGWTHTTKIPMTSTMHEVGMAFLGDDCTDNDSPFVGRRMISQSDLEKGTGTVRIYDVKGQIAGLQMMIPSTVKKVKPMITDQRPGKEGRMYLTAYFVDPSTICNEKVTKERDSIGDGLRIQMAPKTQDGAIQLMTIPIQEKEDTLKSMKWVQGKCVIGMGMHYWFDVSKTMSSDDWFGVFLLYDYPSFWSWNRQLTGFGWGIEANLQNENYEHPPQDKIPKFFQVFPDSFAKIFAKDKQGITTQHVYLDSTTYKWRHCLF